METYLKIIAALNDPTRIMVLKFLQKNGRSCVCELQHSFDMIQSRLSRHLKILKDAGLVNVERKGAKAFYSICPRGGMEEHLLDTLNCIHFDLPEKIHFEEIKEKVSA